jgi:hypothetical protein
VSLQTRLEALASALGADTKADRITMTGLASGSLAALTTTAKTSLLAAINEINAKLAASTEPWTSQALTVAYTNSTVTATDVFTGFTPAANTRYIVDVLVSVAAAAVTTGVQTGLTGPTTGITRSAVKVVSASAAGTDLISHQALNAFQVAAASLTTPTLLSLQAVIEVGTPGAGNIRFQAKSEVAASAITIYPGSSMRWRTI